MVIGRKGGQGRVRVRYLKGEWHVGVPDRESLTVDSANGDPKAVGAVFGQLGYVGGNLKGLV